MAPTKPSDTSKKAAGIAKGGKDIRARVHDLTVKAFRDRKLKVGDLPDVMEEVLDGAAAGLDDALPSSRQSVLREVLGGLGDAFAAVVKATRASLTEASHQGRLFRKSDVSQAAGELKDLEQRFVETVEKYSDKLGRRIKHESKTVAQEGRKAGEKIRPAVRSALAAADGHLVELASETVSTGKRAARSTIRGLMLGASGLLQGLSDSMEPKPARAPAKKASGKSGAKKKAKARR